MTTVDDFTHRFIPAVPQKQAGVLPTLLMLHGTGGNEDDLLELGHMLVPGAALLSPRGNVLEQGMPRYFRRLAEGVFDIEDLTLRTHELANFIVAASDFYHFDPNNVIAAGYSNGANIAASVLLLRPDVLAAAMLFHPLVPLVPEPLPALASLPVFISAGRADPIVPARETVRLEKLLQQTGAKVTTRWHTGGHTLNHEDVREAQKWIQALLEQTHL